jgi:cell wall-associated NlpC family hydrolase
VYLHTGRTARSRRNVLRTLLGTATAAVAGLLVAVGPSVTAHAAPTPAEVERQIDEEWHKVEPLIEQHNKVTAELNANKAKAARLTEQIRPLALQVDMAMNRVSDISAQYYKGGPASTVNAILTTGSPTSLAEQLATLNVLARNESDTVADVIKMKQRYDAEKKPLDELIVQLQTQEAKLAADRKHIDARIKELEALRLAAYGVGGGIGNLRPAPCPAQYDGSPGAKAAQVACNQIGKPYVWAAEGPGSFDCSGLTLFAWKAVGVKLGHYTGWQFNETRRVTRAELKVGDLIFSNGMQHVGMYVGNNWMVHAEMAGVPVKMDRYDKVPIVGYGRPGA